MNIGRMERVGQEVQILYNTEEVDPTPMMETTTVAAESHWSEPAPLGAELCPVKPFDIELLPTNLRAMVQDVSERMQTPLDYAAAVATAALAGCVNRRAIVHPKAEDHSWEVVCNLWGAIVAPPGFMKSPVLQCVTRPLAKIQDLCHIEHQQQLDEHETLRQQQELRLQAWKEQVKSAYKSGKPEPIKPDSSLPAATERRLLLTDSTYGKTARNLKPESCRRFRCAG